MGDTEEFQVIVINPRRCTDCETCMTICSFVHDTNYKHLKTRIIGARKRIELEWALFCDLCKGTLEKFKNSTESNEPQCITACPNKAIFLVSIERINEESRIEAIKRVFSLDQDNMIKAKFI
jgi:Fe-S-cluster-containing hydrogenase component 2